MLRAFATLAVGLQRITQLVQTPTRLDWPGVPWPAAHAASLRVLLDVQRSGAPVLGFNQVDPLDIYIGERVHVSLNAAPAALEPMGAE